MAKTMIKKAPAIKGKVEQKKNKLKGKKKHQGHTELLIVESPYGFYGGNR